MKHYSQLRKIFIDTLKKSNLKCSNLNRELDESDYFDAYLQFLNNSIHFSRFQTIIKGHLIKGKYLNQKVNNWRRYGLFDQMYSYTLQLYKKKNKSKIYHIDGKIITNRYCSQSNKLGRNTRYKSKKSINLQTVTDDQGVPLGQIILKGSDSEMGMMIDVLNKIGLEDYNHLMKSNKHKKYFTCDAGYDSVKNREYLKNKGYTDLIWFNRRNTKNNNLIKNRELKGIKLNKYKKRHIIENYFSWIDTKIPRLVRIYDKYTENYMNMINLAAIDLIINKMCV